MQLLQEGEGAGAVVALRRVDELGYYSLGAKQLAEMLGLTPPKCRAVIDHLGLREDVKCFKEFKIGKSTHGRYAPAAMRRINDALEAESIEQIWARDRAKRRGPR